MRLWSRGIRICGFQEGDMLIGDVVCGKVAPGPSEATK